MTDSAWLLNQRVDYGTAGLHPPQPYPGWGTSNKVIMWRGGRAEREVYVTSFGPLGPAMPETTPGVFSCINRVLPFLSQLA